MLKRFIVALLWACLSCLAHAQTFVKDNGVIRVVLNDYGPIITQLSVNGGVAIPHDNLGADLQFATRSALGDAYNPTQGGDCTGTRSVLTGYVPNWNDPVPTVPAANGVLLGINPRNYNEPPAGCQGVGAIAPYDMNFGILLGDGVAMPRQVMVMEMSVKKDDASASDLVKSLTELPVGFIDSSKYPYVYFSADTDGAANGLGWQRLEVNGSNDIRTWPLLTNYERVGRVIALCDHAGADLDPTLGVCIGLYGRETTRVYASRRQTSLYGLALISVLGDNAASPTITDTNWHTSRRLLLVGNLGTLAGGAAWGESNWPAAWPRW